jgi:hypothetical protein
VETFFGPLYSKCGLSQGITFQTANIKGKKELNVSLFQGVVLLLFNAGDDLSYTFIQKATNLGKHPTSVQLNL